MSGGVYKEFNDAAYTRFRRSLLRTKGGPSQRGFLRSVRKNEDFLHAMNSIGTEGSRELPLCPEPLTENEFKQPPASTEADLYNAWAGLPPRIACRTTFWANLTCRHIESGRINATYLAADNRANIGGAERIDRALKGDGADDAKRIDDCVRAVLLRLGGLPEARANRTVYVNCPLARAWWRERLVADIAHGDEDLAEDIREVTRVSQTYWEELVTLVVSRNSVLGSHTVRNTFILSLADLLVKEPKTPLRIAKNLRLACRMIGVIQASRELSVLDGGEIRALMDDIVELQHKQALARTADGE